MAIKLNIDTDKCIVCEKCTKVCPAKIFVRTGNQIQIEHLDACIACGHCVCACPTSAIEHSLFPPQKVHPIDYGALPTPEQMLLLVRARRSNRAFSKQAISAHALELITQAAHLAPTGSNVQNVSFTVVTDPDKIRAVANFTVNTFCTIAKKLKNPLLKPILKLVMPGVYKLLPTFDRLKAAHANDEDPILRGATTLIFIHCPASSRLGVPDCNLAYQNGSLMAETLGVSQFYLGFVCMAIRQDKKGVLTRALGISGSINAAMGLGMPDFRFLNYVDRKDIVIDCQ